MGWPLLTKHNVQRYYPERSETPKGHMHQTCRNIRSTKLKEPVERSKSSDSKRGTNGTRIIAARLPLAEPDTTQLRGKKVCDVYIKVYDVRGTIFSNKTGQLPKRSQHDNNYIMVLVEIDSNVILIKPMKSCKDPEKI